MKKRFLIPLSVLGICIISFLSGPQAEFEDFSGKVSKLNMSLTELDTFVNNKYKDIPKLKPDNAGYLLWADEEPQKTAYSVVYLHGFSASPKEGAPVHQEFAKRYGCNLYVPLLAGHGIDSKESFKDLAPKDLIDSAKEAIAIGNIIGEKVIVMSCSTGGTLSAYLAAENPDLIFAQMTYSPNIDLADPKADLLTLPWGLQIARQVMDSKYLQINVPQSCAPYWTTDYRIEGAIALKALLEETMTEATFSKIKQPLFLAYYYKNEELGDKTVSIPALKNYFNTVKTPGNKKEIKVFEKGAHVLLSPLQNLHYEAARAATFEYAEEVLGLVRE